MLSALFINLSITPLNQYDYREILGYPTHYLSFDTSAFAAPIEAAQTQLWVPNEDGWKSLYEENIHQTIGIGDWPDLPHKSMKPLGHGLQEDEGDYLRYLIYWKSQC